MRADRFAPLAALVVAAPSAVRAEAQRIVPVEIVVAGDEDDAARARIEGQLSDLAVNVRAVSASGEGAAAPGALRVTFDTTDALSRRVTVTDTASGAKQTRVVELPNGPAALSAQRESVALSARRMIKALLDERAKPLAPPPAPAPSGATISYGLLTGASGTLAFAGGLAALRGDVRGVARLGPWRLDVGLAGVHRAFDVRGYRWSVEGLGPVVLLGVERAGEASRLYAGLGGTYVVGTRRGEGPSATPERERSAFLSRLEGAYLREVGAGMALGVSVAIESEFPRVGYQVEGAAGLETLADSPIVEPSLGLQFTWGAPPAP